MAQRRGYGEGSITKRKDKDGKVIGYQVQVLLAGGKRKTLGTFPTRREAQKAAAQGQADLAAGRLSASPRQTVAAYLDRWVASKEETLRYKTIRSYRRNIEWAKRFMGSIGLDALRPAHIQEWHRQLTDEGLSRRSVQQAHTVLHTALEDAVKLELIFRNPAHVVTPPQPVHKEKRTLSLEQLQLLSAGTAGTPYQALYTLLALTGLRIGEALGLTWSDLGEEARTLTVLRAVERRAGEGMVFTQTKSASSRRTLLLPAAVIETLKRHRALQGELRESQGPAWRDMGLIFPTEVGTIRDPLDVLRHFKRTLAALSLPPLVLHDLRHSCATIQLQEGVSLNRVAESLGHSNRTLVLTTYGHVTPAMDHEAVERLDAAWARVVSRPLAQA